MAALLTDKGYEVVRASRNTQPSLNLNDPASIDAFYKTLGEVDAVICTAPQGGGGFGPITGFSDEVIDSYTRSKLLGQVNLVRKGLSTIRPGGVFILTGGMSGFLPIPKASFIAMLNTDGALYPSTATVAETYLKALEDRNTGQPVFVEGYGPR